MLQVEIHSFNSRTREGCDFFLLPSAAIIPCFNSRTREGCDEPDAGSPIVVTLFQFTHPGGVRPWCRLLTNCYTKFQFTHPGGVRLAVSYYRYFVS